MIIYPSNENSFKFGVVEIIMSLLGRKSSVDHKKKSLKYKREHFTKREVMTELLTFAEGLLHAHLVIRNLNFKERLRCM